MEGYEIWGARVLYIPAVGGLCPGGDEELGSFATASCGTGSSQEAPGRSPEHTTGQRKAQLSARQLSLSIANSKRYGL